MLKLTVVVVDALGSAAGSEVMGVEVAVLPEVGLPSILVPEPVEGLTLLTSAVEEAVEDPLSVVVVGVLDATGSAAGVELAVGSEVGGVEAVSAPEPPAVSF